ncbi:pyridoxine 5'-phosphate synthase [Isosphaeraceae bacterium EP7]
MPRLGVNIDHIATIRQARGGRLPDPVHGAVIAELAGADGITIHLREDRRHIQDRDLRVLRETISTRLNLELSLEPSIIDLAIAARPDQLTFVPERREELTTEGGLDVVGQRARVSAAVARCRAAGLEVSLFIDPHPDQVAASADCGAQAVELHTGRYADASTAEARDAEFGDLSRASASALGLGLLLHAGHGLDYLNVTRVSEIGGMTELNIGHSIIARAIMVGLDRAVGEMKALMHGQRPRGVTQF